MQPVAASSPTTSDSLSLEGATVLITGASSGIGAATAVRLGALGATVVLAARRKAKLDDLVARIGGGAMALELDVTDAAQVRSAIAETVASTGGLDAIISNAGIAHFGTAEESDLDQWHAMVDLNINGVLNCVHAALPHLLSASQGARQIADVIITSSVAGRVTRVNNPVYSATKYAVNAFAEGLRLNVTKRHVRVGLVEPGMVDTELADRLRPPGTDYEWLHDTDIADAIEFMLTRPRRASINEMLIRPTEQER